MKTHWKPEICWMSPNDIHPYENNAKLHPQEQIDELVTSIKRRGWMQPIVIDERHVIIVGHGRHHAAIQADIDQVPVVIADHLTPEEIATYRIADNKIAETGWDFPKLAVEFKSMLDVKLDVNLSGFKLPEVKTIIDKWLPRTISGASDETIPEPPVSTPVQSGDIWTMGVHRIMCGDSTSFSDVKRLCGDDQPDAVFTSPPYNVGVNYATHDDQMTPQDYWQMIRNVLKNIAAVSTKNIWVIWNVGASVDAGFDQHMGCIRESGFHIDRAICWKKKGITGPPIFTHTKKKGLTKYYMPFFGWELIFTCHREGEARDPGVQKLSADLLERRMTDVWEVDQSVNANDQAGHPAAFPMQLASDGIELFCDAIVYEPFSGSGTTIMAAEKTGRRAFGMEKAPAYCHVILDRWSKITGKDPVRSDGAKWSELKQL